MGSRFAREVFPEQGDDRHGSHHWGNQHPAREEPRPVRLIDTDPRRRGRRRLGAAAGHGQAQTEQPRRWTFLRTRAARRRARRISLTRVAA